AVPPSQSSPGEAAMRDFRLSGVQACVLPILLPALGGMWRAPVSGGPPSAPPPALAARHSPPSAARSFPYTSLSNNACLARSHSPGPPVSSALLQSIAVRAAWAKIAPLPPSCAFNSAVL